MAVSLCSTRTLHSDAALDDGSRNGSQNRTNSNTCPAYVRYMAGRNRTPYQCTADSGGVETVSLGAFWVFVGVAEQAMVSDGFHMRVSAARVPICPQG